MTKREEIRKIILNMGADVCGFGAIDRFNDAPVGFSPTDLFKSCNSVISIGMALNKGLLMVEPRLIYGHFNGQICDKIDDIAFRAAKQIEKDYDCICVPIPSDAPNEYWDAPNLTAKGLISMKHTAVACGLGQLGKSTLLLNEEYGNLLSVGAILTDLELESDPIAESICIPSCKNCIESCPAQAIEKDHVYQKNCRPNTYGTTARGFGTVDCNKCRSVCPMRFGKRK